MILHGRVVDQMGHPVPNVPVVFTASAWTRFQVPVGSGRETAWLVNETTDNNGSFTIRAGWGKTLFPGKAGDLGRLDGNVPGPFHYGWRASRDDFHGDATHPVVFMSWNDAFKRIISKEVVSHAGSGWQTVSYRSGRVSPYGKGGENFEFRITRPRGNPPGSNQWEIEIEGIHSKLLDANGPLQREAPEKGYVSSPLRFAAKPADPGWSKQITGRFYAEGTDLLGLAHVYAGVEITADSSVDDGGAIVAIRYTANFSGSRDLVPGPRSPSAK